MGFGVALFVLSCAAVGYRYRTKIKSSIRSAGCKKRPKADDVTKDRWRKNWENDDSDEEEVNSGDAYERWMAVVENNRNSIIG